MEYLLKVSILRFPCLSPKQLIDYVLILNSFLTDFYQALSVCVSFRCINTQVINNWAALVFKFNIQLSTTSDIDHWIHLYT